MEKKKAKGKGNLTALLGYLFLLVVMASMFGAGFMTGSTIIFPSNYSISLDDEGRLDDFTGGMQNFTKGFAEAIHNQTCQYNVNMTTEMYDYIAKGVDEIRKEKLSNIRIVDTFCKKPDTMGRFLLDESRELYWLELNEPVELLGWTFEIIGGSVDNNNIIIDINGARKTLRENDCFTNNKVVICAEDIFVHDIPYLGASGRFNIYNQSNK